MWKCRYFFKMLILILLYFVVAVWLLSGVGLFVTSRTAAPQASLSFTICWSLLKLTSIESVMPSLSIYIYIYPELGLLDHVIFLVFCGNSILKKIFHKDKYYMILFIG